MTWAINWYRAGGVGTIISYGNYNVTYLGEEVSPVEYVKESYEIVYLGEVEQTIQYNSGDYRVIYLGETINLDYKC